MFFLSKQITQLKSPYMATQTTSIAISCSSFQYSSKCTCQAPFFTLLLKALSHLLCMLKILSILKKKKKKKKKTIAISGQLRLQIKPNNYVASQVLQILAWIAYYNEAGGSGGPRPNSSVQIEEERAQVNQKAGWRQTKRYFYSRPEEQLEVRTKLGRILSCWVDLC